jgi:hypothetical protein
MRAGLFATGFVSPNRERRVTNRGTTLGTAVLASLALLGCGGKHGDTYARATDVQGQCCQHLAGGPRDTCLSQVVRVDDPQVAKTSVNQSTYACVVEHFECDAGTGHPTQRSAQAQLECIQDLR